MACASRRRTRSTRASGRLWAHRTGRLGFLVHGSQTVYFAGDTAFFEGMADLGDGLDLALIPVWGWGPTAKPSEHLDPQGAARAVALIKPRFAVPIHWGTLHPLGFRWMRPTTRIDPPHQFAQIVRRLSPQTIVRVLPVGSTLRLLPADEHMGAEAGRLLRPAVASAGRSRA